MDYTFASALQLYAGLILVLISYDIACQWFTNLYKRMEEHWPMDLRISTATKLIPAIPKLHEPSHTAANHQMYSLNYILGVGQLDFECPERVWSGHNAVGNSTKSQGPGSRQDVLDDHFSFWNWQKYVDLGPTLMRKYRKAVADRNLQAEGHRGLTSSLDQGTVERWEAACVAWEQDGFPKRKPNPYHTAGVGKCIPLTELNSLY
jgi:hypothetical protein